MRQWVFFWIIATPALVAGALGLLSVSAVLFAVLAFVQTEDLAQRERRERS